MAKSIGISTKYKLQSFIESMESGAGIHHHLICLRRAVSFDRFCFRVYVVSLGIEIDDNF